MQMGAPQPAEEPEGREDPRGRLGGSHKRRREPRAEGAPRGGPPRAATGQLREGGGPAGGSRTWLAG